MMNTLRPILLIHPDPEELRAFRHQLLEAGVPNPIVALPGVEEAVDFLEAVCIASSADARFRPCLVLIDDTVATSDAGQLLDWARQRPLIANLKMVVLADELPGSPLEQPFRESDQRLLCCTHPTRIAVLARTECDSERHPER